MDGVLRVLVKELLEQNESDKEYMAAGRCEDFGAYKTISARITVRTEMLSRIKELVRRVNGGEDEGDLD